MDETKLCVFCAKLILSKSKGAGMADAQLKQQWAAAMPYGVVPAEEMLVGHVIALQCKKH